MESVSSENISAYEANDFVTRSDLTNFKEKFINDILDRLQACESSIRECLKSINEISELTQETAKETRDNSVHVLSFSGLLELLRTNFDMKLQASIKYMSNVVESIRKEFDSKLSGLKNDLQNEAKQRNGLESRIDKNLSLLKNQINLLIEKTSSIGSDYEKIKADMIKFHEMINDLRKTWKENYDELKSENQIIKKEFSEFSKQNFSMIMALDLKFDKRFDITDARIESIEANLSDLKEDHREMKDDVQKLKRGIELMLNVYNIKMD